MEKKGVYAMRKTTFISRTVILGVLLLAFGGFTTPTGAAGPWYVKPGGNDSSDCLTPATACETINGAIGKASSSDTIYVAGGTYTGSGSDVVLITKDIDLSGGWNSNFTLQNDVSTIDGQDSRRGLKIDGSYIVNIDHLSIQNGNATEGAGILTHGTLNLDYCLISNNSATGGGGIFVANGILTLDHCTIDGNDATNEGGGIFIQNGTTTNLLYSTVSTNNANSGGGIFLAWGTLVMETSTISGNSANGGGGIGNLGGTVTISNGTISANSLGTMDGGGSSQ